MNILENIFTVDIEVLKKNLKEIDRIQAIIESMHNNIKSHERVFSGKEISIQNHTNKTNPIYISGETKDKILELLNDESLKTISLWEQKLKDLE